MRKKINKTLLLGAVITVPILLMAAIGLFWVPHSPTAVDAANRLSPPSVENFLGTDHLGRDIFSRVLGGAGTTLFIALCTVLIGAAGGILVGATCGYIGGWLDEIFMRLSDAVLAFPTILLALVVVSLVGPGAWNIIWVLGFLFIPSFARVLRGEFSRCKNLDYVKRAKLLGASRFRIMFIHIFPNTLPVFLSAVAIGFNNAVLAEASLSFLGIGVQLPAVSLGGMLSDSLSYLFLAPWFALSTGTVIVCIGLGFSILSDGIVGGGEHA